MTAISQGWGRPKFGSLKSIQVCEWQAPNHLGHPLLLSQMDLQGAGLEIEQPGHELTLS